jgi:hypothetical protein
MDLLKQIFQLLRPLLEQFIPALRELPVDPIPVQLETPNPIINKCIEFLEENRYAYLAGKNSWASGKIAGNEYNSILACQDDYEYFLVYRHIKSGVITYVSKTAITEKDYRKFRGVKQTYCNFCASVVFNYAVYGTIEGRSNTLQYWKGAEYSANGICKNLKKGTYNFRAYRDSDRKPRRNNPGRCNH